MIILITQAGDGSLTDLEAELSTPLPARRAASSASSVKQKADAKFLKLAANGKPSPTNADYKAKAKAAKEAAAAKASAKAAAKAVAKAAAKVKRVAKAMKVALKRPAAAPSLPRVVLGPSDPEFPALNLNWADREPGHAKRRHSRIYHPVRYYYHNKRGVPLEKASEWASAHADRILNAEDVD